MFSSRSIPTVLASLAALSACALAAAPPRDAGGLTLLTNTPVFDPALQAQVLESMGLTAGELMLIDGTANPGDTLQVDLVIEGQPQELLLTPHSVRGPAYAVLAQRGDGTIEPVPAGPVRTMRGIVTTALGSSVTASLLDEGLEARIALADGSVFWIEPVDASVAGAYTGLHVVYRQEDVADLGQNCGVTDIQRASGMSVSGDGGGTVLQGTGICTADLSCDADFEYFQARGSVANTEARINAIVNTLNNQYETEVGISHLISNILVRTSEPDPYTSTDAGTTLNQFTAEWQGPQRSLRGDVNEMFTGKNLNGSTIGIAFLNGVCTSNRYNVVQDINNAACRSDLSAHELGHNWGADHCSCPSNTMNPAITCTNTFHPTLTRPEIIAFRDTRGCISCSAPIAPPVLSVVPVAGTGTGLTTADVMITTDARDWWTSGGVTNVQSDTVPVAGGVSILFQTDPNSGLPVMTNVGSPGNPGNPVTFVSLPRDQFMNARFRAGGAASVVGAFDPTGTTPILDASNANIAFLQFPPSSDGTDVPEVGFIARVTLDLNGSGFAGQQVVLSETGPPAGFPVTLGEFRVASATREFTALTQFSFGFYTSEPTTCLGDLSGDGDIDLEDLAILLASFGNDAGGDLTGDGNTGLEDLAILLSVFGTTCP